MTGPRKAESFSSNVCGSSQACRLYRGITSKLREDTFLPQSKSIGLRTPPNSDLPKVHTPALQMVNRARKRRETIKEHSLLLRHPVLQHVREMPVEELERESVRCREGYEVLLGKVNEEGGHQSHQG